MDEVTFNYSFCICILFMLRYTQVSLSILFAGLIRDLFMLVLDLL